MKALTDRREDLNSAGARECAPVDGVAAGGLADGVGTGCLADGVGAGGPATRGFLSSTRHRSVRLGTAGIWLLFIIFPLVNALSSNENATHHVVAISISAGFVVAYVALIMNWRVRRHESWIVPLYVALLVFATTLTLVEGSGWGFLFTYCAACAGMLSPQLIGFTGVVTSTVLAAGTTLIAGGSAATAVGFAASSAGIGLLLMLMHDLRVRNAQLTEARAELARLAVAEERERFARDLHDLLGHTLSVITLKAELAGRLLPGRPEEAAQEMADVEHVARKALAEVRETVSGYHRPTLDGELEGARMALAAAGIEAEVERPAVSLEPDVEAALAWAVREGATNVIRHSHARHCQVKVTAALGGASVEVIDDGTGEGWVNGAGRGPAAAPDRGSDAGGVNGGGAGPGESHGIAGLAERVTPLRGHVEAGDLPEGGYRLAVTVPVGPRP
jgi:two-component system, NarL family, sensor histidine kinase DesK